MKAGKFPHRRPTKIDKDVERRLLVEQLEQLEKSISHLSHSDRQFIGVRIAEIHRRLTEIAEPAV